VQPSPTIRPFPPRLAPILAVKQAGAGGAYGPVAPATRLVFKTWALRGAALSALPSQANAIMRLSA
jgi:hypothetical protein